MPIFCKLKSKIKLVIFFEDGGAAHFYSVIKEDKKVYHLIADKMKKRILNKKYDFQFKRAIFYDNQTKKEFETVFGSQYQEPVYKTADTFDIEKSIVKATMIGMDHKARVYYSRQNEEKILGYDPVDIKAAMLKRLNEKFVYHSLTFECR